MLSENAMPKPRGESRDENHFLFMSIKCQSFNCIPQEMLKRLSSTLSPPSSQLVSSRALPASTTKYISTSIYLDAEKPPSSSHISRHRPHKWLPVPKIIFDPKK